MLYRIVFIILFFHSFLSGQSLFNRFAGTNPFMGSARSTAMGNTHLLNSTGSANIRFNPAKLGVMNSRFGFDFQVNRSSVFERWSMPVRNSFGDFLENADYVANEFSNYGISSGLIGSAKFSGISVAGIGIHYAPLTHFIYKYSEEVRGEYDTEAAEYASRDPLIGYQNLRTDGSIMVGSIGGGLQLDILGDIDIRIGGAINIIQPSKIKDEIGVDTLNFDDVNNLTTLPDINATAEIPSTHFMTFSTTLNFTSHIKFGVSWEEEAKTTTTQYSLSIDSTSGLFQYFDDSSYLVRGVNYMKPDIISLALSILSDLENMMSLDFEYNQVDYNDHLNLRDYKQYKFGFEYITQMGTPIRCGLMYRTAFIPAMKPVSMFTFGSGKSIRNLMVDVAGTYCFQSFSYPDLFPVEDDIRTDYDLIRDSQFNLQLALTYQF